MWYERKVIAEQLAAVSRLSHLPEENSDTNMLLRCEISKFIQSNLSFVHSTWMNDGNRDIWKQCDENKWECQVEDKEEKDLTNSRSCWLTNSRWLMNSRSCWLMKLSSFVHQRYSIRPISFWALHSIRPNSLWVLRVCLIQEITVHILAHHCYVSAKLHDGQARVNDMKYPSESIQAPPIATFTVWLRVHPFSAVPIVTLFVVVQTKRLGLNAAISDQPLLPQQLWARIP